MWDRRYDITVRKGVTRQVSWPITDPETREPRDLSGWTVRAQVRATLAPTAELLYEWVSNPTGSQGGTSTADGMATLILDPDKTKLWTWNEGYYDCELVGPGGTQVEEVGYGRFLARDEMTR